jgi:hypothetical protein
MTNGYSLNLEGANIRIAHLVPWGAPPMIEKVEFTGCTVYGPAVLAILERNEISHSNFQGDMEAMLWEVPAGKTVIGAVGVRDCRFVRCVFIGLGFAGTADTIAAIKAGTEAVGSQGPPAWWPW